MTIEEFDNGYWYADELKQFAKQLGISPISKLRKDELEALIRHFIQTGEIKQPNKHIIRSTAKDIDKGLSLDLEVVHYTSNKKTKEFIKSQARLIDPQVKHQSGVSYRLNRWREEQIANGKVITYRDLVVKYIELCNQKLPFEKIPSGRYINFLSDFLSREVGGTREEAIAAWKELKALDIPKTYEKYKAYKQASDQ